jgi:hypothetical protein
MFKQKFWGTLLLSIPTVIWAPMLQHWFGYTAPSFPGARYIPAVFGALVFAYGGWIFIQGARHELADRRPGMMTLISLAISVAFLFSLAVTFGYPGMDLWWELATLVTIMVLEVVKDVVVPVVWVVLSRLEAVVVVDPVMGSVVLNGASAEVVVPEAATNRAPAQSA